MKLLYPQKLVVLDDEPAVTERIEKILSNDKRFAIKTFNKGKLALEYIQKEQVKFLISDVSMPDYNGDELLYELQQSLDYVINVAIISNTHSVSLAYRCFCLGADVYIKPVTVKIVESITEHFVNRIFRWNACIDRIMAEKLEKKPRQTAVAEPARQKPPEKASVLLVDDDEEIREYIADILGENYEITQAENGLEALEKLGSADIMVLDLNMPKMDGYQLLTHLKKEGIKPPPIIIFSGFIADRTHLQSEYISAILDKPVEVDNLRQSIEQLLAR